MSADPRLSGYFRKQARWRELKAEDYPEDERNAQSARALHSLAEYVEHEDAADLVAALERYLFDDHALGGEETHRAVSLYGFHRSATTPVQHRKMLERLRESCERDAQSEARWNRAEAAA